MQIKQLRSKEEIFSSFKVISQIYEDLDQEICSKNISNMMKEGYKMAGVFEGEKCLGIVGVRATQKLQYGKILEIEDFMIHRDKRNLGVGKMLIKWAEWQAMALGCKLILCHLDSKRIQSHKIFSREKFIIEGFKFKKDC